MTAPSAVLFRDPAPSSFSCMDATRERCRSWDSWLEHCDEVRVVAVAVAGGASASSLDCEGRAPGEGGWFACMAVVSSLCLAVVVMAMVLRSGVARCALRTSRRWIPQHSVVSIGQ